MLVRIITLALAAAGFVWGRIRADIVALIALLVLTLSGTLSPQEALSGFSNPIVVMMVGLFIVGGAIFNTGLAKMIGAKLSHLGNGSPTRLFLVVVLATGLIGGFVSNTGTVALMLPIVVSSGIGGVSIEIPHAAGIRFKHRRNADSDRDSAQPCDSRDMGRTQRTAAHNVFLSSHRSYLSRCRDSAAHSIEQTAVGKKAKFRIISRPTLSCRHCGRI